VDGRPTFWRIGSVGVLAVLASCGSADASRSGGTGESGNSEPTIGESDYCAEIDELARVLDEGGSVDEYNEVMKRVVVASPPDHVATWSLMTELSEEPFSYDNFNPAVDSLDRLGPALEVACPELRPFIVDDSGRVRSYPTE
jgi:hypothetical protein